MLSNKVVEVEQMQILEAVACRLAVSAVILCTIQSIAVISAKCRHAAALWYSPREQSPTLSR